MNKLAAIVLSIFISGCAFGLPLGNPCESSLIYDGLFCEGHCRSWRDPSAYILDSWSLRLGFYGDYVFNRKLEEVSTGASVTRSKIYTNAAFFALNAWDAIELFGTLGTTQIDITTETAVTPFTLEVGSETNFSWSLGGRVAFLKCGCFGVGGEFQYFFASPKVNYVRHDFISRPFYPENVSAKFQEWQFGIGATYRIDIACSQTALLPYAGIRLSRAKLDFDNACGEILSNGTFFFELSELENERLFGYAIGVTLLGCGKGTVTVEGRFSSETAVHFNAQFRF